MRISVNARFLTQSVTGVQRHALELVKALDGLIDRGEVDPSWLSLSLLAPGDTKCNLNLKHIPIEHIGRLQGHLWEQFELPLHTRKSSLVSLCNTAPMYKRNQVVTIHDAAVFAFPQSYPFAFQAWYRLLLRRLGKTAERIITVSEFSKSELIRYCGIAESKVHVVYHGKEHALAVEPDESIMRKHRLDERPFVLAVSSITPNKNFRSIMRATEILRRNDFDIIIAGGTNPKVFTGAADVSADNTRNLGYVSDAELRALYQHAACFVYPSFYEGFGLPPLEAMACGCPVIVSDAASLPEVCGDAALYCDPHSPEDIAAQIARLVDDPALQDELRQKGFEQAKLFTWENTARETIRVYEEAFHQ